MSHVIIETRNVIYKSSPLLANHVYCVPESYAACSQTPIRPSPIKCLIKAVGEAGIKPVYECTRP